MKTMILKLIACYTIGSAFGALAAFIAMVDDCSLVYTLVPAIIISQIIIYRVLKADLK